MGTSPEEKEYAAFQEKVKRTIYADNLAPGVTDAVMKAAFNQFGNVMSVNFIPNYLEVKNLSQAALVEMENAKMAGEIVVQMGNFPFMILGMPRPVRVLAARAEMFEDRPRKPGRKILCQWLDPKDPKFEVANKIKQAVKQHAAEASLMLEQQRVEEEKLATQQNETLRSHYGKFEQLEGAYEDGTAKLLARHYGINISDS